MAHHHGELLVQEKLWDWEGRALGHLPAVLGASASGLRAGGCVLGPLCAEKP